MEIGSIFAIVKLLDTEKVFTIQYQEDAPHIFEQLFDNWTDVEYLFDFFHEHITDLQSPYWQSVFLEKLSVEQAIDITQEQALAFEETMLTLGKQNSKTTFGNALSEIFVPLSNTYYEPLKAALKSYGTHRNSWLRIYAIHIQDVYIITGGTIKLTKAMQDRPHTQKELDKLRSVAELLRKIHFTESTDFDFISWEI